MKNNTWVNNKASIRIAAHFSLVITVFAIFISLCFVSVIRFSIRRKQNNGLEQTFAIVKNVVAEQVKTDGGRIFKDNRSSRMLNRKIRLPYFLNYNVYDLEDGEIVLSNFFYNQYPTPQPQMFPEFPRLPETNGKIQRHHVKNFIGVKDLNLLYKSEVYDHYLIQCSININLDFSENMLAFIPRTLAYVLVPLLLLSFLTAFVIARRTLKPVNKIAERAKFISSTSLDARLPVSKRMDEFDRFASVYNELFERLEKDFEKERSFTGNVSHELKTPVSVISGQANLLKRWGKDDPKQLEESISVILKESKRMEEIVKNLLFLSQLETGRTKIEKRSFELLPLLNRLCEETRNLSRDAEFDFSKVDENFEIDSNESLFYQILSILTSNSVKFGGENVLISVEAKIEDGKKIILFKDNGPGISEETLPHIFERFFRGDEAHNREKGGSGLGLSIAKEICEVLNLKIEAINVKNKISENKGAVFCIS